MDRPVSDCWQPGYVVSINEKYEGLVRLEDSDDETEYPFSRSTISLDERFMDDVIVGAQFFCDVDVDDSGERKLLGMFPRDTMYFEGVITEIHRLEGVAEIKIDTLATPVVFGRAHLDRPDEFTRIRPRDKVKVEMDFYNLISKRKPPRASRVILRLQPSEPEERLRPALRRSSSFPKMPSSESEFSDDDGMRCRSSSQSNVFDEDLHAAGFARRGYGTFDADREPVAPFYHTHQSHPMFIPPVTRFMPPHGQFPMYPPGAGWIPPPTGCMSLPIRRVPCGQGFPMMPSLYPPVCPFGRGSWVSPGYREELGRQEQERSRRQHLASVLNRSGGSPIGQVDDSNVVIEMTVGELRNLMQERRRSSSPDHDDQ